MEAYFPENGGKAGTQRAFPEMPAFLKSKTHKKFINKPVRSNGSLFYYRFNLFCDRIFTDRIKFRRGGIVMERTRVDVLNDIRNYPERHGRHTFEELTTCCLINGVLESSLLAAHSELHYGVNDNVSCDVTEGPCACGAWHKKQ